MRRMVYISAHIEEAKFEMVIQPSYSVQFNRSQWLR
jgi:hypothetical protein